jgi:hypothetical protein
LNGLFGRQFWIEGDQLGGEVDGVGRGH